MGAGVISIYYSNGDVYTGEAVDAPTRDVQAIVQPCPITGWAMQHTSDYYVWRENTWRGTDIFGLWDYLAQPGWKKVIFGRTLSGEQFQEVYQRAKADRDERKTGFLPGERKP